MELGIAGRCAAVAAGSDGLGLATASALVDEGVRVAICGRDTARLERATRALGPLAVGIQADLGTRAGALAFVDECERELGQVDILVLNNGGPPPRTFEQAPLADYEAAVEAHLLGFIAMCSEVLPDMRRRGWGRILAITSIAVREPQPQLIAGAAARSALTSYLKTVSRGVAGDGVTVNSLQPGLHATGRVHAVYGDDLDDVRAAIPAHALGDPADFGRIAAFLCSTSATFLTGTAVTVDGGAAAGVL